MCHNKCKSMGQVLCVDDKCLYTSLCRVKLRFYIRVMREA